jgi:Tol biopolymer transport system component
VDVNPAWSPDRTRLAFERNDQIWVINADGTGMAQLSTARGVHPAWSPDGTRIAYASTEGGETTPVIYVMNTDGSNHVRLTLDQDGWAHLAPDWSPDGSRIVFSRQTVFPFAEIWAVNADGSNLVRIGREGSSQWVEYNPAWSPDGTRIAFNADSLDDLQPVERRLMSMDPTGGSVATIFVGKAFEPTWSPDGSRISYFTTDANNIIDHIFSIAADGTDVLQLTTVGRNSSPAWR